MTNQSEITIEMITDAPEFAPTRGHDSDAGWDLRITEDISIPSGGHVVVGTGVRLCIPSGYVGLVTPRSSLGFNQHVQQSNGAGLIDAGFQGEINLSLVNLGRTPVTLRRGSRVAQIMFLQLPQVSLTPVSSFTEKTARGENRTGSTGL